jgi:hypothetical protein
MPPEKTLRFFAGQPVTLLAQAAPASDMTGWTLALVVRDAIAGAVVLTKTTGITFDDAGRGIVRIALAAADTSSLTPSAGLAAGKGYVWDLRRTDTGFERTLAGGSLILEGDPAS